MNELIRYVLDNTQRGDCVCGKCVDAATDPKQPSTHTVDLTFFKVTTNPEARLDEFKQLVQKAAPQWLDGQAHSYLDVGADVGDQGFALAAIGLGGQLKLWKVLSPETMAPFLPDDMKKQMAGMGMISLQVAKG